MFSDLIVPSMYTREEKNKPRALEYVQYPTRENIIAELLLTKDEKQYSHVL
jgi:hypothetical protein